MIDFRLIADFACGQVVTRWQGSSFALPAEVLHAIEQAWQRQSARPGVRLFDGPMCRLESFEVDESPPRLTLVLSPTSYKPFVGTNLHNAHLAERYGLGALANPVGLSCGLIAADGFLMMGRRNNRVAYYPDRVHPFAGALEPPADDVFGEVLRELREELHLLPQHISEMRCLGIAEDRALHQPELIFTARSTLPRAAIEARLSDEEHEVCVALSLEDKHLRYELADHARFTPVGLATVLLCGRALLGTPWFDAAATTLCIPKSSA